MGVSERAAQFFQLRQGWVFNPWLDFIAFYVPLLTAVYFQLPSASNILALKISFDIGHLFVTLIPLYFLARSDDVNMKPLVITPILVLIAAQVVCYFNFNLFSYCFGYYALFHICSQLYGWLARIQRNSQVTASTVELVFERVFLTVMLLSSVLFWHTSYSTMARGWFYENNFILEVRPFVWEVVNAIFLVLLACWIGLLIFNFFVKRHIPFGKILLLFAVWLMFYYSRGIL